jgi:hypothetical protein
LRRAAADGAEIRATKKRFAPQKPVLVYTLALYSCPTLDIVRSPTPLRRAVATDARDAQFSLVSSLQWARLSERLEPRVTFTCLSNRSSRLVSNDWNGA